MATRALRELEERVRQVERRGGATTLPVDARPVGGVESVDWERALAGAVPWPRGMVHEWFSRFGPAVTLAGRLIQRVHRSQGGLVVWVGRWCWPHPRWFVGRWPGRGSMGEALFVDPSSDGDRLWAVELCVRSPAVTGVIADGRGLTMSATRRLQLAARDGGSRVMLLRSIEERKELSASAVRWLVEPVVSPGRHPRWSVELLRCKGLPFTVGGSDVSADATCMAVDPASVSSVRWILEDHDDTGLVPVPADLADRPAASSPQRRRFA